MLHTHTHLDTQYAEEELAQFDLSPTAYASFERITRKDKRDKRSVTKTKPVKAAKPEVVVLPEDETEDQMYWREYAVEVQPNWMTW